MPWYLNIEFWTLKIALYMKSEAPEQKNEGLGWPRLKKKFWVKIVNQPFLYLSLYGNFFLDHYYGSYEHLIIADYSIVSPLFCHFRFW